MSGWRWILAAAVLAPVLPVARAGDEPVPRPAATAPAAGVPDPRSADAAAAEILRALRKGVSLEDLWDGWSVWTRWGFAAADRAVASDLAALVEASHAAPDTVGLLPAPAEGNAKHVDRDLVAGGRTWRLLLLREEGAAPGAQGWKLAAATLRASAAVTAEAAAATASVVTRVLKAIDGADAKGFAALSVDLARPGDGAVSEAEVATLFHDLHVKYGGRPTRIGPASPCRVRGKDGVSVPVLFGDAEDLLLLAIVDGRLAQVSVGDPAQWPPDAEAGPGKGAAPEAPKAPGPGMGEDEARPK